MVIPYALDSLTYFPFVVQVPRPLTTRSSFNLVGAQGIVNVLHMRSDDSNATSKGRKSSKKNRE